jgi:hercynine metabolism protein
MSSSWFEQLEARLEQQLEEFLNANPHQQSLLDQEELQERERRLRRREQQLQQQAIDQRNQLLALASDISTWQQRVERARGAQAPELASKAQAHVDQLMGQGRDRWKALAELGEEFRRLRQELEELGQQPQAGSGGGKDGQAEANGRGVDLERDWAEFETQQELERLRRNRKP